MPKRTCPICGATVPTSERGRPRAYCSKTCSRKASRDRNPRACSVDGCTKPHGARGMCYSHYGTWHRHTNGRKSNGTQHAITCIMCGAKHMAWRPDGKFCSDACKGEHYSLTKRTRCKLPADHPVMVLIAEAKAAEKERRRLARIEAQRSAFAWRTARQCPGCACWFTPLYTPNAVTCSNRCARRCSRRRRRAREAGARGSWTWAQFMAIARKFDYCCAYCGIKPERLDPDHVVPLSRGGYDSPANLLPTCAMCNSSKCAMTLAEWAAWLATRGLEPRATTWVVGDSRYVHLTQALLAISPAA